MLKFLWKIIESKYGQHQADSFVNFVEQDELIKTRLRSNFRSGVRFCLEILRIARME